MEEVLANIGSEMAASTDWREVMNLEEVMAQKEGIVKGWALGRSRLGPTAKHLSAI